MFDEDDFLDDSSDFDDADYDSLLSKPLHEPSLNSWPEEVPICLRTNRAITIPDRDGLPKDIRDFEQDDWKPYRAAGLEFQGPIGEYPPPDIWDINDHLAVNYGLIPLKGQLNYQLPRQADQKFLGRDVLLEFAKLVEDSVLIRRLTDLPHPGQWDVEGFLEQSRVFRANFALREKVSKTFFTDAAQTVPFAKFIDAPNEPTIHLGSGQYGSLSCAHIDDVIPIDPLLNGLDHHVLTSVPAKTLKNKVIVSDVGGANDTKSGLQDQRWIVDSINAQSLRINKKIRWIAKAKLTEKIPGEMIKKGRPHNLEAVYRGPAKAKPVLKAEAPKIIAHNEKRNVFCHGGRDTGGHFASSGRVKSSTQPRLTAGAILSWLIATSAFVGFKTHYEDPKMTSRQKDSGWKTYVDELFSKLETLRYKPWGPTLPTSELIRWTRANDMEGLKKIIKKRAVDRAGAKNALARILTYGKNFDGSHRQTMSERAFSWQGMKMPKMVKAAIKNCEARRKHHAKLMSVAQEIAE